MGLVFLHFITDSEIVVKTIMEYRGIGEKPKNLDLSYHVEENVQII